ncbi:MAG: PEP-CTERM sorting domain-containing protein [Verrucomicrobiota bacterium JB023]|nr:PEP-CTERM sorting domain-containing protein [Verrucomicrobiota bacterium JB023]
MKLKIASLILGLSAASLSAVTTLDLSGTVITDTGAYDGTPISITFEFDETVTPDIDGFLPNSAVSVTFNFQGQSFSETDEIGYLDANSPFYAAFFTSQGELASFSFAAAANQGALDAVTGFDSSTFPLDNPITISDQAISGFLVNATVVPEPSAALLALLGFGALARRRR